MTAGGAGTAQQQQIQLQQEDDERIARDMEALEADIVLVNELFTTLATYVHDQGELVDSIEANTEAAYVQVSRLLPSYQRTSPRIVTTAPKAFLVVRVEFPRIVFDARKIFFTN